MALVTALLATLITAAAGPASPVRAATQTFANPTPFTINDNTFASLYPSTIAVSNLTGVIVKATVTLNHLAHSFPDDIGVLLVAPSGKKILVMADSGGGAPVTDITLTFDDAGPPLPDEDLLTSGTFRPTAGTTPPPDVGGSAVPTDFIYPAPRHPYASQLSVLNGDTPNGTWALYILDDSIQDGGALNGGWSLALTTTVPPVAANDSATAMQDQPVNIDVLANDHDADGTIVPASLTLASPPAHGSAQVNGSTGRIVYTPAAGYSGSDALTYTARDNDGATSNVATVSITISPAPPASPTVPAAARPVSFVVSHAGTNRLQVSVSVSGTLQSIAWTPGPGFAVELTEGTPLTNGVLTLPSSSSRAVFYVRRLNTSSVTLPLTLTGSFGTWRTFVGGGPDAW